VKRRSAALPARPALPAPGAMQRADATTVTTATTTRQDEPSAYWPDSIEE
jgi:hypothetical protein